MRSDRTFDRQMAYLGLLDDAAPIFRDGSQVPGVGVLLALPYLVHSGVLQIARKLYGEIGPAFYGLRTTLVTLFLMALLRIQRPEQLKERDPAAFGRATGARSRPRGQDPAAPARPPRRPSSRRAVGSGTGARARGSAGRSDGVLVRRRPCTRLPRGAQRSPRPTWRGAIWPCPPPPITGSTTAGVIRCCSITADLNASLAKAFPNLLRQVRAVDRRTACDHRL